MTRKEELLDCFKGSNEKDLKIISPLIDKVVYLESELEKLEKLPKIKVHPKNPEMQKPTAAAKLYKDYLQTYNYCIKNLCTLLHKGGDTKEESPLRKYLRGIEND